MLLRAHSCFWLLVLAARMSFAACGDDPGDQAAVAMAQAAVETACPCATATSRSEYIACARSVLTAQSGLRPECRQSLARCAARSVCGRPGAVTCCRTRASGVTRCAVKKDASRCTVPLGGSACVGVRTSCCDACVAGACAPPPTTTTSTVPLTCGYGPFPTCGGTCGPGDACLPSFSGGCECFPAGPQPCGVTPACNEGICPTGERCGLMSPRGGCGCVPEGSTACGETMTCGSGSCPSGQSCYSMQFSSMPLPGCGCAPTDVPCCEGGLACGVGQTCGMAPMLCFCFP